MLDDSYLYEKDFNNSYETFRKLRLKDLYKSLYENARLSGNSEKVNSDDLKQFLDRFNKNLRLINELVKDNYELQHQVHQLGIKNRIKKKLGKYRPPETVKRYVTQSELEEIVDGSFLENNYLPHLTFGIEALNMFASLTDESFESGIRNIHKAIKTPKISSRPTVSIIITTRNGVNHLRRLFENFAEDIGYSNYEIIIVDNASTDETIEYLESLSSTIKLKIIKNAENKSFSESNNIAARQAKGTFLLFLNNDMLPTPGWLNHLVSTATKDADVGAVGAKLVYPHKEGFSNSYRIQHGGIGFSLEENFIRPINVNNGSSFFSENTKREEEKIAVTAACLLVEKSKFDEVEGFDEKYWYGYEDVDLCLKLHEKGYKNIINNAAVLFHYEFGTQEKFSSKFVSEYRRGNIKTFKDKWQKKLYPAYWQSLLKSDGVYTNKNLHFCFATTESSDQTAAGDFFTAKELGTALEKKGHTVSYIGVRNTPDPYDIDQDVDVLISMIDGYDISEVSNGSKLVKIAWCRNWFERWAEQKYFRDFDIVLSNSEKAQDYFKKEHHIDSYIFKIATNSDRFTKNYDKDELAGYESDICFTGNYWHSPRDIVSLFDIDRFHGYKIKIFGKDWDHVKEFKPFHQGFLEYKDIPKVYASGKLLIDDATSIVNEWGSVNSRVFDGAASGILVLTNGASGNVKTFDGLLPTFNSKEELSNLIEKYLGSEKLRLQKINEIRDFALRHHTYELRAEKLAEILEKELARKTINIKMPIPRWSEANSWGDLHFAVGIKKELEQRDFNVKLQTLDYWEKPNFGFCNIVIRGLSVFSLPGDQLNVMWNISHPDKVSLSEYRAYDYVFTASKHHAENLKKNKLTNAGVLYQCYDKSRFNNKPPKNKEKYASDILFVGNTRNMFRKIVHDVLSWPDIDKYVFKVYGKGWDKFIDKKYIAGEFIDNDELRNYYMNTKILLNDHWEDMSKYGFVSNRLFDASACGTFIISDKNSGIQNIFGQGVIEEYDSPATLHALLDEYVPNPNLRKAKALKARQVVQKNHTFTHRVDTMLREITELSE